MIQFLVGVVGCILGLVIVLYLVYLIKDLPRETLEMITTVVPYCILMRNEYFVEWYKNKFKNVYWDKKVWYFLDKPININNRKVNKWLIFFTCIIIFIQNV